MYEKTARLNLKAEDDDEMAYLAWLANHVRGGHAHELYLQEKATEPGVLDGLTEELIINAREVYRFICEGRPIDLESREMEELEEAGLIHTLRVLPGRGRYAGRFEFMPSDRLYIVVYAMRFVGISKS